MEKYLILFLLVTPGYIAKSVARLFGDPATKRGELESVLVYFTYNLFAFLMMLIAAILLGLNPLEKDWITLENQFKSPIFCLQFFLLSIACSTFIGVIWQLKLERFLRNIANRINYMVLRRDTIPNGSVFNMVFVEDKKEHFVAVEKEGKIITLGFLRLWSPPDSEKQEFFVSERPIYREWMAQFNAADTQNPFQKVVGVYYDASNGTILREYEFPKEWLPEEAR
jgi:hypothetical protein